VGIGDDCSVEDLGNGRVRLVTTDLLVEDVHFVRSQTSPGDLGWKCLAVNLSDIAAMGGEPRSAYLSLGLPDSTDVAWLDAFVAGFRELALQTGTALLGGDTTGSPGPVVVNVVATGEASRERVKTRSGAERGDIICVTDRLGDSAAGLQVLSQGPAIDGDEVELTRRHLRPRPHLEEGAWLARRSEVSAMIDLSDGVDSDVRRIMERSACGARIDLDTLPLSEALRRSSERRGWDPIELAGGGGEDYCLLTTVALSSWESVAAGFERDLGRPLYRIGEIAPAENGLSYLRSGRPVQLRRSGFDHFDSRDGNHSRDT
jgi:thiamine-monophosphate kinase